MKSKNAVLNSCPDKLRGKAVRIDCNSIRRFLLGSNPETVRNCCLPIFLIA